MKTSVFILVRSMISSPSHAECYVIWGGHFAPQLAAARPHICFSRAILNLHHKHWLPFIHFRVKPGSFFLMPSLLKESSPPSWCRIMNSGVQDGLSSQRCFSYLNDPSRLEVAKTKKGKKWWQMWEEQFSCLMSSSWWTRILTLTLF